MLVMHMCMCKMRMHMYMCCAGGAATAGGAAAAGAWKAQVTDSYFAVVLRAPVSENVVHSEIACFENPSTIRKISPQRCSLALVLQQALSQALPATRTHIQSKCRIVSPAPG